MPPSETAPREDFSGLSNSRAEFAASLQRRIETVLLALADFEAQPASSDRRDNFLRRIHALRASAKVLGFAAASEILAHAEQQIRTCSSESPGDDIRAARKQIESLPSLVLRGAYSVAPPSPPSVRPRSIAPLLSEPLAVVVWGTPDFVELLRSIERSTTSLELSVVDKPDDLRSTCAAIGPDVLLLDANLGSIALWVDELAQAAETSAIPIVVANVPEAAGAGLQELGARLVLPSSTAEHQLSHALFQVRHPAPERTAPTPTPFGDITLKDLAERLAQEIRLGLVDSAPANAQLESIPLAEGTAIRAALWSALAQIREQVADASAGRIQFHSGPEGGSPLAPRSAPSARPRALVNADAVDLTGRRILVVDDDPAVAWFVGGTLRAAGALVTELHDGTDALELTYRVWPELIVSDVLMPGLDGFALCHSLKRDVLLRDIPIVLLSWKEDLLFRLRELGADADGYLRKEANASTIVRRVRELLLPRSALERRLANDRESRGRLDGITTRLLLELASNLERPVRITLRDSTALYDIRVRHGTLAALTRTRHDGTVDQGETVLAALLGITAARFSVVTDREACEPTFFGPLTEILLPSALRTRAAQRVLSGATLATIDRIALAPEAFGGELPPLPLSLRPIADELLRGTSPRQLLATGVASTHLLESLLSDLARRGSIRSIEDVKGQDLLESEILRLRTRPAIVPPKPISQPQPQFTFQLSPAPPEVVPLAIGAQTPAPDVAPLAADRHTPVPDVAPLPADSQAAAPDVAPALDVAPLAVNRRTPVPDLAPRAVEPQTPAADLREPPSLILDVPRAEPEVVREASASIPVNSPSLSPSLTGTSLLPQQFTVTSNPPPSDDFDWAAELSWDTTPPPAQAPSDPISLIAFDKAGSLVDEPTRPEVPRLDGLLQRPPEPGHALAHSITASETTPTAQVPRTQLEEAARAAMSVPGEGMREASPPARLFADLKQSKTDDSSDALNLTNRKPSATDTAPAIPNKPQAIAAATPNLHQTLSGVGGDIPRASTAATPVRFVDTPGEHLAGESPAALPVVHQPPRPRSDERTKPDDKPSPEDHLKREDHPSEDPIFPLVSAPTSPGVEIQPSIDIGPAQAPPTATGSTTATGDSVPAQAGDTLRSPSGSQPASAAAQNEPQAPQENQGATAPTKAEEPVLPEAALSEQQAAPIPVAPVSERAAPIPAAPVSERLAAPIEAESDRTLFSPVENDVAPRSIPSRSANPSSVPADRQRQVGWMQAVGLATLAGIVTFAATVPIASWFHRRNEPLRTEPPIATDSLQAPAPSAEEQPKVALPSASPETTSTAPESTTSRPAASASIEEIPVPSNVTLKPGEALIEVTTGGDHAIFVDDTFVGRGPVRVIPVANGRHIVRTRLNGAERSDPVDLTPGRALRLSLEQAWK